MKLYGVPGSGAWAYLARCLLAKDRPALPEDLPRFAGKLVVVREKLEALEDVSDAFLALAPLFEGAQVKTALFGDDPRARLASLEVLRSGARLVLGTPSALASPAPSPDDFKSQSVVFENGQLLPRSQAIDKLVAAGYQRVDFVETPGEFAARGAVLDFYGLEPAVAVRVLYDEDVVASLRAFDPGTQDILEQLSRAQAVPAQEPQSGGHVRDWLGEDALWLVEEGASAPLPPGAQAMEVSELTVGSPDFGARPNGLPRGRPEGAWKEIAVRAAQGQKVLLYSLNRGEDSRIQEILEEELPAGACQFLIGPLRQGFAHPGLGLSLLSTSEIFQRDYRPSTRWKQFTSSRAGLAGASCGWRLRRPSGLWGRSLSD